MIAGESSGAIKVGKQTGSLTLIQVAEGLAPGSTIEINTTEGSFDAEGDIHIGGTTPTARPFDGRIRIYDKILGSVNGHLKSAIDVIGCHDDEEILNICVDGNDGGNITLPQTDCTYQTATHSCGTCP